MGSRHSTIPAVKKRLVQVLEEALRPTQVSYAWPGAAGEYETIFLGYHPELRDIRIAADHDVPVITAARTPRQETYTVPVTVWSFRPEISVEDAEEAEARGFELAAALEDALADDVTLGLEVIQWAKVGDLSSTLWPFENGWAAEVVIDVAVQARLV